MILLMMCRLMSEEEGGIPRMNKHSPKVKLRGSEFRNSPLQEHYPALSTSKQMVEDRIPCCALPGKSIT
jgi:hypothetical protein